MGDSGGRSRNHKLGSGASHRASARERSYVDPPRGSDTEWEELALEDLPGLSTKRTVEWAVVILGGFLCLVASTVVGIGVAKLFGLL